MIAGVRSRRRSKAMKLTLAAAAIATLATCLLGQATKAGSTGAASNAEQTLKRIEQEMLDALLKGSTSANDRYIASDAVFTMPDGDVVDKARLNADLKS